VNAPRIGITTSAGRSANERERYYVQAVTAAGGEPVWLEPSVILAARNPEEVLGELDGLLLSGGGDIDPRYYGEIVRPEAGVKIDAQRDAAELLLTRAALASEMPIFGICRGIQTLNVAGGGSLHQDLRELPIEAAVHRQARTKEDWEAAHSVTVTKGSRVAALLGGGQAEVNSFHHQAVKAVAADFVVTAQAPDGVIEAIEHRSHPFALGVQWHPERMVSHSAVQRKLFEALMDAARIHGLWAAGTGRKEAAKDTRSAKSTTSRPHK
jgi:putative glutamine amidotransferase